MQTLPLDFKLDSIIHLFDLSSLCRAKILREAEHPLFFDKKEIGIFWSFTGLSFSLFSDLLSILEFHGVLLCQYTLGSIGCMTVFFTLSRDVGIPFSLKLFCLFFIPRITKFD